jgi:hypothetical protein
LNNLARRLMIGLRSNICTKYRPYRSPLNFHRLFLTLPVKSPVEDPMLDSWVVIQTSFTVNGTVATSVFPLFIIELDFLVILQVAIKVIRTVRTEAITRRASSRLLLVHVLVMTSPTCVEIGTGNASMGQSKARQYSPVLWILPNVWCIRRVDIACMLPLSTS